MPPSCISLHQLPFPDFLTVCRSLVNVEATVRWFNLITAQLASPERVIQHVCHLCVTALAVPDNSDAILVTHVKFRIVNYSCTPSLPFPSLPHFLSAFLSSWSKPDCCEIIQKHDSCRPPSLILQRIVLLPQSSHFEFVNVILSSLIGSGLNAFMLAMTVHFFPFHFVWGKCNKAGKQWNW